MAIRGVVTRGYGPGATIPLVVTRGYGVETGGPARHRVMFSSASAAVAFEFGNIFDGVLLQEDGGGILQEDGFGILLEQQSDAKEQRKFVFSSSSASFVILDDTDNGI